MFSNYHIFDTEKETQINQVRAEWLTEIDKCEKFNLTELENREDKYSELEGEKLFKKFMFEFTVCKGKSLSDFRLIAIDKYFSSEKVECFQIAMNIADEYVSSRNLLKNSLEKLFVNMRTTKLNVRTYIFFNNKEDIECSLLKPSQIKRTFLQKQLILKSA
jgi:hypothetical protein